jgi:C1A family cysteine protease
MPDREDKSQGGHSVLCVGYDDNKKLFRIRNSWEKAVGENGYFYIPYDYVTNPDLASDFWVICGIEN